MADFTLPPDYIDSACTGRDRELLEAFYLACLAEGGSANEIDLRGIHAAIAADRRIRPQPTPEALQAAYAAWFKAEQGIPPSPAAARTAAAFTLAVLRGEVEL